jgi:SAM-dependent methyltransferase
MKPEEFDKRYFDGRKCTYSHNAGYSEYRRMPGWRDTFIPTDESGGEFYRDLSFWLVRTFNLEGRKVLDVGCAYGFIVEDLRSMNVNAWGIDVSEYAISQASKDVRPYLVLGDALLSLHDAVDNAFDLVFSRWFMNCLPDMIIPAMIAEFNRISHRQVHIIFEDIHPEFYTCKPIEDWLIYDWKPGTILMRGDNTVKLYEKAS